MNSLDTLLTEVGPILASSQFAHPSFREVLAAKQFAEEINSGKISVKEAYERIIVERYHDYDFIKEDLRPVLHHMVELLREEKALELVDLASDFPVYYIKKHLLTFRAEYVTEYDWVVEDLVICSEFIGKHRWADSEAHNRAKEVLDILGEVYDECAPKWSSEELTPFHARYQRAFHALNQAKSIYANKLLNARINASMASAGILNACAAPDKIREFSRRLVRDFGVDMPLEVLLEALCIFTGEALQESTPGYLRGIFEVIKEGDFKKEHIQEFNAELEKYNGDGKFMKIYHYALNKFSKDLKSSGIDLYGILEKKGVQFLDSEVYKKVD